MSRPAGKLPRLLRRERTSAASQEVRAVAASWRAVDEDRSQVRAPGV